MAYIPPGAGAFRHMVRIERRTSTKDQYGTPSDSWSVVPGLSRIAASIVSAKGGEEVRSMRASGIDRFEIVLRTPTADITIGDRMIDHTGKCYDIKWCGDLEGRGRQVNLTAEVGGLNA